MDENWVSIGTAAEDLLKEIGVSPEYDLAFSIVQALRTTWNVRVVSSESTELVAEMIRTHNLREKFDDK